VDALVHAQLRHLRETRRADLALEWSLATVRALVHGEVRPAHKALAARAADVRAQPAMRPHVLRHVTLLAEQLAAEWAREWARARVRALVVAQLAHGAEDLGTRRALERFLSAVNALVSDEFCRATIRFSTDFTPIRTLSYNQSRTALKLTIRTALRQL